MSSTSNHYYGHDEILRRWVGLEGRPRPIAGVLQHGWTPRYPWLNTSEQVLALQPRFVPRFVWSKADEEALRAAGGREIRAVGAPFLYLQEMLPEPQPPPRNRLLALAFHTSERQTYDPQWDAYADWLEAIRTEFDAVEVCLHPLDYANPAARRIFERRGLRTFMNGDRDDPGFLWRQQERIQAAAAVTTPRLNTGLIYAAAMGRRVFLGGPAGAVLGNEVQGRVADDRERAERFQRERYPELFAGIEGEQARSWGRKALGEESLQSPGQLGRTLGWLGRRRALAWMLAAGAAVQRARGGR